MISSDLNFNDVFLSLWKVANNEDRGSEEDASQSGLPTYKEYEELQKANKLLWIRVEDLQKENQKLQQQQQQGMSAEGIV